MDKLQGLHLLEQRLPSIRGPFAAGLSPGGQSHEWQAGSQGSRCCQSSKNTPGRPPSNGRWASGAGAEARRGSAHAGLLGVRPPAGKPEARPREGPLNGSLHQRMGAARSERKCGDPKVWRCLPHRRASHAGGWDCRGTAPEASGLGHGRRGSHHRQKLGSAEGLIQNESRPVAPECVRARGRQETLWSPPARVPAWLWLCSAPCALGSREPGQGLAMTQTLCGPQSLGHPRESRKRRPHYEAATSSACLGLALTGTFSGIFSGRGSEGTSGSSICS